MFSISPLLRVLLCFATLSTLLVFWLLFAHEDSSLRLTTSSAKIQDDRSYFPATPELCQNRSTAADLCSTFPHDTLSDVQITVKTGIGERHSLEGLLTSYGSCISNLLIVSDAKDDVQGQHVHDILADLPASYAQNNSDWSAYEAQRQTIAEGTEVSKSHEAWKLDRFKFLPMVLGLGEESQRGMVRLHRNRHIRILGRPLPCSGETGLRRTPLPWYCCARSAR
jgi:hypothetical protein